MLLLYSLTIFFSALLLFLVQPMFARMVLPLLGGSPAVWNTAMVFYQAALLAGYAYAHASTARLGVRRQAGLHMIVLLLPLLFLPIGVARGWTPPESGNPTPWLLMMMLMTVGLPFFVVSTSSPLLQKWFSQTGHPSAADPYFLYAASNAGSMLALLAYPALLEPRLSLADQSRLWSLAYFFLVALMFGCALYLWRTSPKGEMAHAAHAAHQDGIETAENRGAQPAISTVRRLRWVVLAFVPSSLMLSVTTYLSTDIAAIPLLWVIPLALYLLTFIVVFQRRPWLPHRLMVRAWPILVLPLAVTLAVRANQPLMLLMSLHLLAFFVAAMVCHGELAHDRPAARDLTGFYLAMSLGGVLGGAFNALLAPILFSSVLEYPLVLILTCLLMPAAVLRGNTLPRNTLRGDAFKATEEPDTPRDQGRIWDIVLPAGIAVLTAGLVQVVQARGVQPESLRLALMYVLPILLCFSFSRRPPRFALGVGAILLSGIVFRNTSEGQRLYVERSFFGINRVSLTRGSPYHELVHGSTLHGMQNFEPARRRQPLTYYYPSGPIGQILTTFGPRIRRAAIVGLGTGTLAAYGRAGQNWTYFEIDPAVEHIARDPNLFTYLSDTPATLRVVLGDARLSLGRSDEHYDVVVLDAYSSDAIPVHLITREALRLYVERLAPGGLVVFHISNRHFNLEPVLDTLARDAGLFCRMRDDADISTAESNAGKSASRWVVMARRSADLGALNSDARWKAPRSRPDLAMWTDDYSSLLSVFTWE